MNDRVDTILLDILPHFRGRIPDEKLKWVSDFIEHGERGLAYQALIDFIVEMDVKISDDMRTRLEECGNRLWSPAYDAIVRRDAEKKDRE